MKFCTSCATSKELSFFGKSKQSKDGYKSKCNQCLADYAKKIRANPENKEKIKEQKKRQWERTKKDPNKLASLRERVNKRRQDPEIRMKHNEQMREIHKKKYNSEQEKERRKKYYEMKKLDHEYVEKKKQHLKEKRKNQEFKTKLNETAKRHYQEKIKTNPEKLEAINKKNREKYQNDLPYKEMVKASSKKWRDENKEYKQHLNKKRELLVKNRIPKWADIEKIKEFYANRPSGFHVDHVIPISGKNVSGFHVIENLQYLPANENLKKSNSFDS